MGLFASITVFLFGTAMSLTADATRAQPPASLLRLEGEFLPYSANAPIENYDVVRSAPAFVPPGQRLRIERDPSGEAQDYLWTWLPPLHAELCNHPFWKAHCAAVDAGHSVSVPVQITTLLAEGTPENTTSQEFNAYWVLAVFGLKRGETVYRITSAAGGPNVWAYATDDGYLAMTPELLPRIDRNLDWQWPYQEPKALPAIQVLTRASGVARER